MRSIRLHALIAPLVGVTLVGLALSAAPSLAPAAAPTTATSSGAKAYEAKDVRFGPLKDYNGYFPFTPPESKEAWAERREAVRRRILVSQGLWPLPTKTPLNAVVHGRVERDDFTVDRVFFESVPGHFVCGSLFKPKKIAGQHPVILCPHGHWANGRFYDAGEAGVAAQIKMGAEKYERSGRYPLQARCVQLARLGCIVFHYDMIGYADSTQVSFDVVHKYGKKRPELESAENWGFYSPQAESRAQSTMGLQTWNSVRALDFVTSLPEVDPSRIGVTGASGGGTQTVLLGAIDDRVDAIVPAVMVSTAMQGGCTCENASLLRIGTGNIEFAALFAPKPQALLAANDWTKEIMTKGFPELKKTYELVGKADDVEAHPLVQFPHNYNYVSRAAMYEFFNKHFRLGAKSPIVEEDFVPLSREELTVWTADHPQPDGGEVHERDLVRKLTLDAQKQIAALTPKDSAGAAEFQEVVGGGFDAVLGRRLADVGKVEQENLLEEKRDDHIFYRCVLKNGRGEEVLTEYYYPTTWNKQVVVVLDADGAAKVGDVGGRPNSATRALVAQGYAVAAADLIGQGKHVAEGFPTDANRRVKNERLFAGYTYGFNDPLFVQRVHDVLTVVAHAVNHDDKPQAVHLVGLGRIGPVAAAAAAQCGDALAKVAVGNPDFRFESVTDYLDPSFVPGIVKYGDVPGLLAAAGPKQLLLVGSQDSVPAVVVAARKARGESAAEVTATKGTEAVLEWLKK